MATNEMNEPIAIKPFYKLNQEITHTGIQNYVRRLPPTDSLFGLAQTDPVAYINRSIEGEIKSGSRSVGMPVAILRLTRKKQDWLQNKLDCKL